MKASDISTALAALLADPNSPPPILWSAPGCGKSDITETVAQQLGADLLVSHPVVDNPTDAKGFPWLTQNEQGQAVADFVPFGTLRKAMAADKLTIWFLDDLGQAIPAVQGAYMQLVLARRINGHVLPDCVRFVAASNRVEDRAGANKMITPLLNRFLHLDMEVSVQDWQAWAVSHNIRPDVRAYLNWKPSELFNFDPTSGQRAFPTPRSWEFVSNVANVTPDSLILPVVAGCIGEGPAAQYIAFRRVYQSLPDEDMVLSNPQGMTLPTEPSVLYALIGALVEKVKAIAPAKLNAIGTLASRMTDEYAVLLVRDTMAVRPAEASNKNSCPAISGWVSKHLDLFAGA